VRGKVAEKNPEGGHGRLAGFSLSLSLPPSKGFVSLGEPLSQKQWAVHDVSYPISSWLPPAFPGPGMSRYALCFHLRVCGCCVFASHTWGLRPAPSVRVRLSCFAGSSNRTRLSMQHAAAVHSSGPPHPKKRLVRETTSCQGALNP